MKKLLSLIISVCLIASVFALTCVNAYAAGSKFNEQKQQFNSQNAAFNFEGNRYVCVRYNQKAEIYLAASFGKKEKLVTKSEYATYPTLKGDYVYWLDYAKGAIMRCKTNGKGKKAVLKFNVNNQGVKYIISGKKLIYLLCTYDEETYKMTSSKLYQASLTGKNKKFIADDITGFSFYTNKNKLYFLKSNKLYSYNFKTKKAASIKKGFKNVYLNSMEGANLYYFTYKSTDKGEEYYLKKINVGTKKVTKLGTLKINGMLHSMITSSSGVFVSTSNRDGEKGFGKFRNGKIDYSICKDKYDIPGDDLAYYKNFVVFDENKLDENGLPESVGYIKTVKIK